ncbi:MAG: sensor histidine kinase [Bacteroidetes bacterium]|nr:MAG: sensor histidine kinase [Bacteroidota bacterium]
MFNFLNLRLIEFHFLRQYLVLSLFCFAGFFHLDAQLHYSIFDHLTVDDGLSSNRIRLIYRDSRDYLWIGTDVGLDKYDSYQVKKYRYNKNQPGTISSDIINAIYEDRGKNLWFGTMNGLNLYDRATDNFKVFKSNPADRNSISGNYINSITEDKDGIIWIITDRNCLNKWVPETQNFVRYQFESEKDDLDSNPFRMMANDSKGYLWLVSLGRGIHCFDPVSGKFTKYDDPAIDFAYRCNKGILIDNQDKIWIATDGSGFYSFDPATKKFEHFGSKGDGKGTNQIIISDILQEDNRYLLLAVDQGGINRFDKVSETFEYIVFDQSDDKGLNNNGIVCLHRDKEGILWIGTSGGGINYYNPKKERFKLFRHNGENPKSLSYNNTCCFYEDHQGLIWIGTDGGGVNVYDPKTGNFEIFKHEPANPFSISGNVIRAIAEDKDHDMWIGTWDAGLNRYDRETGRFFRYLPDSKNPATISNKTIWNLIIDHNNNLWLSIYNVGIDFFEIGKGVTRRFRYNAENPGSISGNNSWFFFEDDEKKMWICTHNGVNLYDSLSNSFKVLHFPDDDIGAFYKDKAGYLWVGTNTKGLFLCTETGTILKTYDITNVLPNNRIHAIIQDNKDDIWISSNYGISRLNTEIQSIRNYSKEDGLQDDQFYPQSFLKTHEGELYFGGYSGFNSFFPDSLKDNDFIPPVYITDFQIFNKPVVYSVPGAQIPVHISEAKEIKLRRNQSVFSFSFAAINYTHPVKNQYAYIMEGFEKDWNYTDASRRYVTYTNLDPGKYTFRVKASNNDGVENTKGVSLRIYISPPWWNTLWFRLIMIFVIVFLIVSIFISRVRHLNNQKIMLEKLVAIKTAELKELNASKDKFFSIIAHDLKAPFNSIIGLSGILKEELKSGGPAAIEEYAGLINTSAVQTFRLLENLLEWANSQRGKIVFKPGPIILRELYTEEFSSLNDMATAKNIELIRSFQDDLKIIADKNMLKTILRNLISNAIKFTHKNGRVEVKAITDNSHVEISVSDNGLGMTKETVAKLFRIDSDISTPGTENEKGTGLGLILCKEFIERHGGKIWVESESGKGSIFKFILPLDIKPSV